MLNADCSTHAPFYFSLLPYIRRRLWILGRSRRVALRERGSSSSGREHAVVRKLPGVFRTSAASWMDHCRRHFGRDAWRQSGIRVGTLRRATVVGSLRESFPDFSRCPEARRRLVCALWRGGGFLRAFCFRYARNRRTARGRPAHALAALRLLQLSRRKPMGHSHRRGGIPFRPALADADARHAAV